MKIVGMVCIFLCICICITVILIYFYIGVFPKWVEEDCTEICRSNNLLYYKSTLGGHGNSVCYCKDIQGKISTYVM